MSKISFASGVLALAIPFGSAFAQASGISPSLPEGHSMISACNSPTNSLKYGSLSAVPLSGDKTEYALVMRDLAQNSSTTELVTTTRNKAEKKVQNYCNGSYTPARMVPYNHAHQISR